MMLVVIGPESRDRRLATILLALLGMFACAPDETAGVLSTLPDVPTINLEPLTETVKNQFAATQTELHDQPLDGIANKKFAQLLHAYSLTEPASVMYHRCESLRPRDLDCLYLHALVLKELGRDAAAIDRLKMVLARMSTFPRAAVVLADSYRRIGEFDKAAHLYTEALRNDASLLEARYGLASVLINQGQMSRAQEHLEKIHAGSARFGTVHTALATVYRQAQNATEATYHTAAAKRFAAVKIPFTDERLWDVQQLQIGASRYTRDADRLFKAGRLKEAAELYLKVLEINPQNDSSHANLVGIYGQLQQMDKAREHYSQALALNAENILPHMNLGTVLMKRGDFTRAALAFAEVLKLQPQHAEARTLRTYCAELLKQNVDVDEYRLALRHDPTLPLANYLVGRHTRAASGCKEALPFFEKSIRMENAGTVAFMPNYASCLLSEARTSEAVDVIKSGREMARKYGNPNALQALEQIAAQIPAPGVSP